MNRRDFIKGGFMTAGAYALGAGTFCGEPWLPGLVSVGGWQVAQSKIEQGIEHSEKAKIAQMEVDAAQNILLPQIGVETFDVAKFLKWKGKGNRYIHTYIRVGDYDFHGIPANPKTGEPKSFVDFENSVLRIVVMKTEVTDRIWQMLEGVQLPFCPIHVAPQLELPEIFAHFLDIGMAYGYSCPGRECVPYEADNWHELFPWLASPVNSNTATATFFKSIGATGIHGERSVEEIYRDYTVPGADHNLFEKLKDNIGSWFWNRVQAGERRLDALAEEYWQKWNSPSAPAKPVMARVPPPSFVVG